MADETTTRDALSAAFDKHAEEAPTDVAASSDPAPEAVTESAPEAPEALPTPSGEASPPDASASTPTAANAAPVPVASATPPTSAPKAPRSWSAEAKAAFATLPEPVKQDVLRREREISQGLERTAPARAHFERFSEVVKPFEPLLQAYGVDAVDAMKVLLSTRAGLEIGSPEQKAAIVANIVHDFGVDIAHLDDLLTKRGPVKPFQHAPIQPPRNLLDDPSLAPLRALAEQVKQSHVAKATAEIDKVATLPHFEEVREDIADIVETFHNAGKTISLESAYKRALAMNPDLEPAVAAPPVISKSQAAAILASRNAASSVSGSPRTGATQVPDDRRSQISAAFDAARR